MVLIIYTATYSPYRTSFHGEGSSEFLFAFETMIDCFFLVDIFVNFITPYKKIDSTYEYTPKKISKNYLKGLFTIDIITCFPTQFFETGSTITKIGKFDGFNIDLSRF